MVKRFLSLCLLALTLLSVGNNSAKAEYQHVFHKVVGDGMFAGVTDYYMDFDNIISSPVEFESHMMTRYIVPVYAKIGDERIYEKFIFMNNPELDEDLWYTYYVSPHNNLEWYNIQNWDAISIDYCNAHLGKEIDPKQPARLSALDNDFTKIDYFDHVYFAYLKKTVMYKKGLINGHEPVINMIY